MTRTICLLTLAFVPGMTLANLTAGAQARPAQAAKSSKHAGGTDRKARKPARKRPRPLVARSSAGRSHVPASMLGPRWSQIGGRDQPPPTTSTAPSLNVPATTTTPTTTPTTTTPVSYLAFGIRLSEWSVSPTRGPGIEPGNYTVQLQNHGQDPHDLLIYRESDNTVVARFAATPKAEAPGRPTTRTAQVEFTKPGRYQLFCTLVDSVNHRAAGMYSELTVISR